MSHELTIAPSGHLLLLENADDGTDGVGLSKQLVAAFGEDSAHGLLHLATSDLQTRSAAGAGLCAVVRSQLSDAPVPDADS